MKDFNFMEKQNILIWGAGKIGRGFIADIFNDAGYGIIFVDQSKDLIDLLNRYHSYPVVRARAKDDVQTVEISNYNAYHISETVQIHQALEEAAVLAVSVFPKYFSDVANQLQTPVLNRMKKPNNHPLDILLCTNLIHAGPKFKQLLITNLDEKEKNVFEKNIGVVESLIIRISPSVDEAMIAKHPLIVLSNGYPELPVDKRGFKGAVPNITALRQVEDMRAEEIRKIYTYNMLHALISYHGSFLGYDILTDCLNDPDIIEEAREALAEISLALQKEFSFSAAEMDQWINGVIDQTNNPVIQDTVLRSAADPIRKLKRDDRLLGPLFLCIKHNIQPKALIRAIGAAFNFKNEQDSESLTLAKMVEEQGIEKTVIRICDLSENERFLIDGICKAYTRVPIEYEWILKARQAFNLGYRYEKNYHGCGQSVFAAVTESLGIFDEAVFRSATGLCGGIGLDNDSTCSAFSGGVMAIGMVYARRRESFDSDKKNKYINFKLCQELRKKMSEKYGSTRCGNIHEKLYGRAFNLRDKGEAESFEAAGAHDNGCTSVVGDCAKWTVEILLKTLFEEDKLKNAQ